MKLVRQGYVYIGNKYYTVHETESEVKVIKNKQTSYSGHCSGFEVIGKSSC